jgi:hypothetical protein
MKEFEQNVGRVSIGLAAIRFIGGKRNKTSVNQEHEHEKPHESIEPPGPRLRFATRA